MTAFSEALQTALAKAQSGGNGNRPTIKEQQMGFTSDPVFAELFRAARATTQANLRIAQANSDLLKDAASVRALQTAQHNVEEVERQIIVARELFSLAIDVDDEVTRHAGRVDSWLAMVGNRAAKLVRRVLQ
ncbi:hypothetical protein [Paraburkholderia phosphatilytica]|uniref:hypothetical protein n=1 Tax=Paraburkholderia phosphatilytica TaxID=2282883 RepID=UPI000E552C1E|nr:hypothetical protein [Paraburkholderia phosphatilytica]